MRPVVNSVGRWRGNLSALRSRGRGSDTRGIMSTAETPLLFRHAPVASFVVSREGQIVDANPEAVKVLGDGRSDLVGTPVLAFVTEEDRARARENFLAVLTGKPRDWSGRCRRGDGSARVMAFRAVPLLRDGAVRGVMLFLSDVTQDQSGRPERNQMQALLENLPGQFLLTLDDGARIRYASGISRTHYLNETDAIGSPYRDLLEDGPDNLVRTRAMRRAIDAGGEWAGTHWHVRADGTAFPVRIFATPHRDPRSGKVIGGLVVGRDVSVEYDLRHRAEHAERLAALGEMVGEVGERIGGVARDVEAAVGPLIDRLNGSAPALRRGLEGLAGWTRALEEMTEDVALERRPTAVHDLIDRVLAERRARIEELEVELRFEGVVERSVNVDPERSRRAVLAVLDNALDALGDRLGERLLHMSVEEGLDGVILRIRDNGSGIPNDRRDDIYAPFHTTRPGRPGLGLTRARDQIRSQGGRIWHTSNGGGTTVAIELPYEAPEASFPFRPIPLTLHRQKSILVVDDEDSVRSGIRRFLEKVGYDVREAWSGRSALAQLTAGQPPELVLTDLKMSDGSGYWFLDQLARDFPALLERTLVITGDTDHAEVAAIAGRTGVPVLRKPIELPELLERLDEVARR